MVGMTASATGRPTILFLPPPSYFSASRRRGHDQSSYRCQKSHRKRIYARPRHCACLEPTDPPAQYVPLHVHSDFSLLDGASQLPSLVQRAEHLGVPALALTDHGVLYGAIQLVKACSGTGVKPIIGNEMYIVDDGFENQKEERTNRRYHLIVIAKNTTGYRNLVKLTSLAHLQGRVGRGIFARPCINKALLYQYREGLVVSSACLGGEIAQAILNGDVTSARSVATWYRDVFGADYYLEIQDHGSDEDKRVNPVVVRLGKELGIPVIATNDSHFTSCLDAEAHDAMICIQTGKLLSDDNRLRYAGNEYFKSVEEMRQCFADHLGMEDIERALSNTVEVAGKVEEYDLFGDTRIPDFPIPDEFDGLHDSYLALIARKGLRMRLDARQTAGLADAAQEAGYIERLEFELEMIAKMGFSTYFLVVWDYIRYAREQNIPVGPGRGSVAGSLVAFSLRITDVDPIAFNLLFERFLNPERKSMPDIDTDFSVDGRDEVISYVTRRYGADRVAQIITFNRLTSKAVLKDVARVHSVPYSEADRLAKLIPVLRGKPATLTEMLSEKSPSPEFRQAIERTPSYRQWIEKARRIEGANKTYGIHAAGVVISSSPLTDVVPLSKGKHGETITQYAMEDVESLGLLKMDFLGLKNLTVIETALRFINEGRRLRGIEEELDFSVDALPLDDAKTYQLLAEGELDGVFQLDASGGMRNVVRELRPSSLEDISSILALYRPGPLDAGLIPKFIRRKHGVDPIQYDHPLLQPILEETYGVMVYQEQIMRIARDLAGYSLGQADILRRAMGKKKTAIMEQERPRFLAGAKIRGLPHKKAEELFDMMIRFAEYCFNKSHSTAYAYLTYQTAYLKANYPVEYSAALLRSNMNQSDKLVRYLADANLSGVRVAPPSVNRSQLGFTVDRSANGEAVVLFGLEAVKTVGESVSTALLEERNERGLFKNIVDLIERVNLRVLNKRAVGALIQAGSFDDLHPNRKVLLDHLETLLALRRKLRDKKKRRERKQLTEEEEKIAAEEEAFAWEEAEMQLAKDSRTLPDFSLLERFTREKATLGFYASGHPLLEFRHVGKRLGCTPVSLIVGDGQNEYHAGENSSSLLTSSLPDGSGVMIMSCVTDLKRMTTAKGKKMAKWIIEDSTGRVPGLVFPTAYEVVEQRVVHPEKLATISEGQNLEPESSEKTGTESPLVVEEGSRVVVWGKVDRESSGTVQIIVDDVQLIEDVQVIMATAQYHELRSPSTHLQVIRHMAARVLEVDLSQAGFKSYKDANGEIRKRRWTKSVPLSKKNRIPLVLQCVGKHGNIVETFNVGNDLRFSASCLDLLKPLIENTGFDLRLLTVSRDILGQDRDEFVTPTQSMPGKIANRGENDDKDDIAHTETGNNTLDVVSQTSEVPEQDRQGFNTIVSSEDVVRSKERPPNIDKDEKPKVTTAAFHEELTKIRSLYDSIKAFRKRSEREYEKSTKEDSQQHVEDMNPQIAVATAATIRASAERQASAQSGQLGRSNTSNGLELKTAGSEGAPCYINGNATGIFGRSKLVRGNLNVVDAHTSSVTGHLQGVSDEDETYDGKPERSPFDKIADSKTSGHTKSNLNSGTISDLGATDTMRVDFDVHGLSGVLDAAAFLAGKTVTEKHNVVIRAISGLDLSSLTEEGVLLQLTPRKVHRGGKTLYVSVDVKETTPSGKRKRARSFGPIVFVFSVTEVPEIAPIKTKKAKKEIDCLRQRLEKARDDVCADVNRADSGPSTRRRRKRVARSSEADFVAEQESTEAGSHHSVVLSDIGETVSAMTRAAGLCLDRGLGLAEGSHVSALDGFSVENLETNRWLNQVMVRTHLEGLCFGTGKIQVEANLNNSEGVALRCRGSFRVSAKRRMGQSSLSVLADTSPLFDGSEVCSRLDEACTDLPQ